MKMDLRVKTLLAIGISVLYVAFVLILSGVLGEKGITTNENLKSLAPSSEHFFGTDWMGRDMLTRTVKGLCFSLNVGLLGSLLGVLIAVVLGIVAALGGKMVNGIISWLVDLFIGMPHLIFMILISFVLGRGAKGVIIATAITHWPSLARVIRNEVLNIKNREYIRFSINCGKSSWFIVRRHILPVIMPQIVIGFILLFPHVILHEASMTFLGFGLSAKDPSVGIILSEAVKHILLGDWWLVVLPGLALVLLVKSFDNIGESLRMLSDPQLRYL